MRHPGLRSRAAIALSALTTLSRNRSLVLLELSWTVSVAASWTFQIAALIVAYRLAGAAGVAAVGLAQMLPSVIAAPLVVLLERRLPGRQLLLAIHAFRLVGATLIGAGLIAGASPGILLVLVALKAAAGILIRPIQFGLAPALASAPEELVAANVGASTGEGLATLIGPVVGGFVMAAAGPVAACTATGLLLVIALVTALAVQVDDSALARSPISPPLATLRTGWTALRQHPGAGLVIACFLAQVIVRGVLSVLLVVTAIELLGLGDSGVGLLNAAIGLGGFLGALMALTYAGANRLSIPFVAALIGWGLPIAVIGAVPLAAVAGLVLVVLGASNAMLDVTGFTLLQRLVPNAQRTAVFGLLEGLAAAGVAIGSVAAPVVLHVAGTRGALVGVGIVLPVVALIVWPRLSHVDREAVVPERELVLLRSLPIFAPLPMTVIERLAGELIPVDLVAGDVLMRQGDAADCFYAIEDGAVEVVQDGRLIRTYGPGAAVGEIGLLRRVPRTATVRAASPTRAYGLRGEQFVAAVTGNQASVSAAESVIADRLSFAPRVRADAEGIAAGVSAQGGDEAAEA